MIRHAAGIFILVAILAFAGCMAASQTAYPHGNDGADRADRADRAARTHKIT